MNRFVDYQNKEHQINGKSNQYYDNSSVGGLSGSEVNENNTLPTIPIGPALAPPGNENLYVHSESVDQDQ